MPETRHASPPEIVDGFKRAMRRLASTVTIISARAGGRRFGITATAVVSVTISPPTLLICINTAASVHAAIADAGRFCVNLLGAQHADLVAVFSGKVGGEARFDHGAWSGGGTEPPVLADAQASLTCVTRTTVPYGTHTIFIGEVVDVRLSGTLAPLLYQDGSLLAGPLDTVG